MTSMCVVSQRLKSRVANGKLNFLLSVNRTCNVICAGVTRLLSQEESNHRGKTQSLGHNASECTPGRCAKPRTHRPGRELTKLFAFLLSLQTRGHLKSHKLGVTTWAQRSGLGVKQHGYQTNWLLTSVKLKQDKTI